MYALLDKSRKIKSRTAANSISQFATIGTVRYDYFGNKPSRNTKYRLPLFGNSSKEIMQQKKGKGVGVKKAIRKAGAVNTITELFQEQHMGNYKTATKIAEQRAGTIPGRCHVISIDELPKLYAEINEREKKNYHAVNSNKVLNDKTNRNQFKTDNSYKIFEFKYDKKNRLNCREINAQFYYDTIPNEMGGFALHHFDGVVGK